MYRIANLRWRSNLSETKKAVDSHYDAAAEQYHLQYHRDRLFDLDAEYPANYFRLQILLNAFVTKQLKRIIEVGVGETVAEAVVAPDEDGALAGLVVDHQHLPGAPVVVEVEPVVGHGEGLEQGVLAVVEVDLE